MPSKEKYKTAKSVTMRDGTTRPVMISNGSYKPRTGNSHPKKSSKSLKEFIDTGRYQFLSWALFQDLVNKGVLPEGNYLITVGW